MRPRPAPSRTPTRATSPKRASRKRAPSAQRSCETRFVCVSRSRESNAKRKRDVNSMSPSTGVLLIQLGTPDAPTPAALRVYLRQFLSDPRVIETPRWLWWFILNLFILPRRPAQSAAKYQRIWDPKTGSPLLHYTRRQTKLF